MLDPRTGHPGLGIAIARPAPLDASVSDTVTSEATGSISEATEGGFVRGLRTALCERLGVELPITTASTPSAKAHNIHAHPTLGEAIKEAIHGLAGHMINM